VHPLIITKEDFELAQATPTGRGSKTQHRPHSRPRAYALRGVLHCALCGRKMSGKWNNDQAYYLCRFPVEYALANKISHPRNVYLREADVLGHVDDWLAQLFAPGGIGATVDQLAEQAEQLEDPATAVRAAAARERISTCDDQIAGYRASIDAGGDPAVIGPWIAETQAKKVAAQAEIRAAGGRHRMSRAEIEAVVTALGELARLVQHAETADRTEIYAKLRLSLTYEPGEKLVAATIKPGLNMRKGFVSEGGLEPRSAGNFPNSGKFPWIEHNGHCLRAPGIPSSVPLPGSGGGRCPGRAAPGGARTRSRSVLSAESGQAKYPPIGAAREHVFSAVTAVHNWTFRAGVALVRFRGAR
jgi:site-specific DNA recombinase